MFAVIADGGRQYRVEPGMELQIDLRAAEAGEVLRFEEVLLAGSKAGSVIGHPLVAGAVVEAEVVKHRQGKKLEIGKYRRRKNSRRHTGHRQLYTAIKITAINAPGVAPDPEPAAPPA